MGILSWLANVLNVVTSKRKDDRHLESLRWQIDGGDLHPSAFLRALPILLPEDCFLVLDPGPGPALPDYPVKVTCLNEVARLAESYSRHNFCHHLYAYDRAGVVLRWYDAFADPFQVSERVPRERIEAFCRELNVSYEPI